MVKFPEADERMFRGVFVCRRCKSKLKAPNLKVAQGRISCRKCSSNVLRPVRKK